jgi:drug/metabolite transporter (DMT)-like permease
MVRAPDVPRPARALNNQAGLIMMATGFFLFAGVDAIAKLLTQSLHPFQIVWTRQLGLLVGILVVLALRGPSILRTRHPAMQIGRGAIAAGSATLFIFAVRYVPLADATAVSFVAPFMVTLMGAFILREPVGLHRWSAVIIGFLATLIVIRPGMGVIHPAVMLVVLAATLFALRQVLSRILAATENTATTVAYTALTASALLSFTLPFVWTWPGPREIALMAALAFLAGIAEFLVIKALEVAQAVVLAPLHYTLILWSTLYGWLLFHELPDRWTWAGAALIIAMGLYTMYRERLAARRATARTPRG